MENIKINRKNIIVNSSVLFVIAAVLEMTIHEFGHFVAAIIVGAKDIALFHNYVTYDIDGLTSSSIIFVTAAGPNVSLLIGLIFHYICYTKPSRNLFFLFCLYMAIFGYIGCFGYLMTAPFFEYGDTGYICYVLDFPTWLTVFVAIIGAVLLFLLMKNLTKYFVELGTKEIIGNKESRYSFIMSLILLPLIIGIAVTSLLNLPAPSFLSLLAPICSPLTILWTFGYALHDKYSDIHFNKDILSISKIDLRWIVILLLVININRLLTNGFII